MNQTVQTLRSFLALPISARLRQQLAELTREMTSQLSAVRWVRPDNYHLTMRFLGDVPASQLQRLQKDLEQTPWPVPFCLPVGEVGAFPTLSRARVIKVGASNAHLMQLHSQLEAVLMTAGWESDPRFTGHITLGRVRSGQSINVARQIEPYTGWTATPMEVERMVLVKSELRPQGAIYTELASYALGLPAKTNS